MNLWAGRRASASAALAHGQKLDLDGLPVRLSVNPRARRISVRIDVRAGEAVATAPSARRLGEALAFAGDRRGWIGRRLAAPRPVLSPGETVSLFGAPMRLVADGRRPRISGSAITGCGQGAVDPQLAVRAIRAAALATFRARAAVHCASLGVAQPSLSVSDPASRWGSCTPPLDGRTGAVRLSWRLALAPFAVADYVVAHECAHLLEANHGPRFWALVGRLVGDPAPHRAWLKRHGPALQAFARAGGR